MNIFPPLFSPFLRWEIWIRERPPFITVRDVRDIDFHSPAETGSYRIPDITCREAPTTELS